MYFQCCLQLLKNLAQMHAPIFSNRIFRPDFPRNSTCGGLRLTFVLTVERYFVSPLSFLIGSIVQAKF